MTWSQSSSAMFGREAVAPDRRDARVVVEDVEPAQAGDRLVDQVLRLGRGRRRRPGSRWPRRPPRGPPRRWPRSRPGRGRSRRPVRPRGAKARAPARPRPEPAPVMTTIRSVRRMGRAIARPGPAARPTSAGQLRPKVPGAALVGGARRRVCKVSRWCMVPPAPSATSPRFSRRILWISWHSSCLIAESRMRRRRQPRAARTPRTPGGRSRMMRVAVVVAGVLGMTTFAVHDAAAPVGPEPALRADCHGRMPGCTVQAARAAATTQQRDCHRRLLRPEQHPDQHLRGQLHDHADDVPGRRRHRASRPVRYQHASRATA